MKRKQALEKLICAGLKAGGVTFPNISTDKGRSITRSNREEVAAIVAEYVDARLDKYQEIKKKKNENN